MAVSGRRVKSSKFLRRYHRRSTGLLKSETERGYNQRASTHRDRTAWQQAFLVSVALESDTAAHLAVVEASVGIDTRHADHGMEL
jgi:hypothetical protein